MTDLYIGLMSGTSADGIDAALVDFTQAQPTIIATHYIPYSSSLRQQILALCQQGENEIHRMGELDIILGREFARVVNSLLERQSISARDIKAIGSHGQTVRHYPQQPYGFTLQIGDPNTIAAETGITTVADFRRKDVALGGQGAPLVPAFHQQILSSSQSNRAVVNIGGIANVTLLPQNNPGPVTGFDTGPGNTLMDAWTYEHLKETHDKDGIWASKGRVQKQLLETLLTDPYFQLPPPKSTGREYFNQAWLRKNLTKAENDLTPADVQATLAELTARSIIDTIKACMPDGEILICGGGARNALLMSRLSTLAAPHFSVDSTAKYHIDPDWLEAMAFAWLARQTINRQPGNLPSVTGAKSQAVLGGVYYA